MTSPQAVLSPAEAEAPGNLAAHPAELAERRVERAARSPSGAPGLGPR
ncbi:hypothetical protein [Streptomyces sp. SID5643]